MNKKSTSKTKSNVAANVAAIKKSSSKTNAGKTNTRKTGNILKFEKRSTLEARKKAAIQKNFSKLMNKI